MKFKKAKFIVSFILVISILLLNVTSIYASTNEILTYVDYVNTPTGNVGIGATLTVQQSNGGYIVDISNAFLSSHMSTIVKNTISLSTPTIWAGGAYATVTVTYILNGTQVQEKCIFYP
ncbi:MAG: hypothetical protein WBI07_05760 [Mobilitalea sp.]